MEVVTNRGPAPSAVHLVGDPMTVYRGSPSEIIRAMVPKKPKYRPFEDQVVYLLEMAMARGIQIVLPDEGTVGELSQLLLVALVRTGLARELPKA